VENYVEIVESNVKCSFLQGAKVENNVDNRGKCVNNKITLWKSCPQRKNAKDMISMKKHLAICSIIFTICATFTACGSDDTTYNSNSDSSYVNEDRDESVKDHVDDAIDGVGDAGGDLIEGVTDAAGNIIDGLDGKKENHNSNSRTTSRNRR